MDHVTSYVRKRREHPSLGLEMELALHGIWHVLSLLVLRKVLLLDCPYEQSATHKDIVYTRHTNGIARDLEGWAHTM